MGIFKQIMEKTVLSANENDSFAVMLVFFNENFSLSLALFFQIANFDGISSWHLKYENSKFEITIFC